MYRKMPFLKIIKIRAFFAVFAYICAICAIPSAIFAKEIQRNFNFTNPYSVPQQNYYQAPRSQAFVSEFANPRELQIFRSYRIDARWHLYVKSSDRGVYWAKISDVFANGDGINFSHIQCSGLVPKAHAKRIQPNFMSQVAVCSIVPRDSHMPVLQVAIDNYSANINGIPLQVDFELTFYHQKVAYGISQYQAATRPRNIVEYGFYCSPSGILQSQLNFLYERRFTCDNGEFVFLDFARNTLQEHLQNMALNGIATDNTLATSPLEEIIDDDISYFDSRLIVIERYGYLYTGGSHGTPGRWGVVFGPGGIIHLNEIINLNHPNLKQMLWQEYQKYLANSKQNTFVSFEDFRVSDIIVPSYNGLRFIYQPYEIMPYVSGIITLVLPYRDVAQFGDFLNSPLRHLFY